MGAGSQAPSYNYFSTPGKPAGATPLTQTLTRPFREIRYLTKIFTAKKRDDRVVKLIRNGLKEDTTRTTCMKKTKT